MGAPLFGHPVEGGGDRGQPLVQAAPRGAPWRAAIVGQRAADGEAVPPRRLRRLVVAPREGTLDGPHAAHFLLEQHFGVPVGRADRLGGLAEVVALAQLVGHPRQGGPHGVAERLLPVRDHPANRHRERGGDLTQERHQLGFGAAEQAARQEHRTRQAIARHPQHLVSDIGLQPVQREDGLILLAQALREAALVGQPQRHQLLVAGEQIRHAARGDRQPTGHQRPVDLRDATVLGVA